MQMSPGAAAAVCLQCAALRSSGGAVAKVTDRHKLIEVCAAQCLQQVLDGDLDIKEQAARALQWLPSTCRCLKRYLEQSSCG
jgi:hypothetical protein